MKKRMALLLILGISLTMLCQNNVFGYSPHYLPGGTNYLSQDNFSYIGDTSYFKSEEPFLVKAYQEYTLSVDRDYVDGRFGDITIEFYDNETYISSIILTIDDFSYIDYEEISLYTSNFMTTSETNYISITFLDNNRYFETGSFNVQLEEGDEFTSLETYADGELIDTSAPYFQNSGTVISYFDSPITINEIQSTLTAYDAIDGDVSDSITLVSDNYTPNMDKIGTYQCVFSVSDSSQNTEEVIISVELVDVLSPVFTELDTIQAVYPNVYTVENILEMLSASDNYDGDISSEIVLVNDDYSVYSNIVGTYQMEFEVTDSSGNNTRYTQNIEVVDNEGPIISGITEVIVGYDSLLTESDITMNLNCTDNYDSQELLELILVSDSYTENSDTIGHYEMVFTVTDSNENTTTEIISIEVVDEIGPAIYFNSSVIQTYSDNVMSLPDFTQLLINTNEMLGDKNYSVTIEYDSYTRNASVPGTYHLKLNFEDETGDTFDKDFQIVVVDRPADYLYSEIEAEEPENQVENELKQYIIGGVLAISLVVSNVVWAVIIKKKQ